MLRLAMTELVGVFGLVLVSAGVVCVNQLTSPAAAPTSGTAALTLHQPGLVGVALAQGLILAALLTLTVPITGGYLNPAITLAQWGFGRIDTARAALLIGAQIAGSLLAGGCLYFIFQPDILAAARFGAPHVNPLAYPLLTQASVLAGCGIELVLTFFLAYAMFGALAAPGEPLRLGLLPGMIQVTAGLFALPLTGAALNPVRWFGPVVWDSFAGVGDQPWSDFLVYLAGPMAGALLAGWYCSRVVPIPDSKPGSPKKK